MTRKLEAALTKARPRRYEEFNARRVQYMEVVSRKSMYGFYREDQNFIKVYLRYPEDIATAVKLSEVSK